MFYILSFPLKIINRLSNIFSQFILLERVFIACVAAVKWHPVLHYCVVLFSFFTFQSSVPLIRYVNVVAVPLATVFPLKHMLLLYSSSIQMNYNCL